MDNAEGKMSGCLISVLLSLEGGGWNRLAISRFQVSVFADQASYLEKSPCEWVTCQQAELNTSLTLSFKTKEACVKQRRDPRSSSLMAISWCLFHIGRVSFSQQLYAHNYRFYFWATDPLLPLANITQLTSPFLSLTCPIRFSALSRPYPLMALGSQPCPDSCPQGSCTQSFSLWLS